MAGRQRVGALGLVLLLIFGAVAGVTAKTGWLSGGWFAKSPVPSSVQPEPVAPQSPGPLTLAKEYVYGPGGRIIATEEPVSACSPSISPSTANYSSNGGNGTVTVTAGTGCNWTAVSNAAWITITSGASGTGNGSVGYSVGVYSGTGQRSGTMIIAGQTFTVTQDPPTASCSFSISPTSANFASIGGAGSVGVTVTAGTGCSWTAVSNATWITITSGASGIGNGTVGYSVAAYSGSTQRSGTMTIAGQTFTVTQDPVPAYEGYIGHAGCDNISGWAADHNRLNVSINVRVYDGATLIATVLANQSRPDVGAYLGDNGLHGYTFVLPPALTDGASHAVHVKFEASTTELANSPTTLTCAGLQPNYEGYIGNAGCTNIDGWAADRNRLNVSINVQIYDGSTLIATVLANQSRPDVGVYLGDNGLHGFTFTIPSSLKDGANHAVHVKFETSTIELGNGPVTIICSGCSYSLTPTSQSFVAAGGTNSVSVTTQAGCAWTAGTTFPWITINSGASGTGSGSVSYSVAPNTGSVRSGTIIIAGQTFTVNQDPGCSFSISPASASYGVNGGTGSVSVTANNQACSWTAVSNAPWITVTSGSSGTGNGSVGYSVALNPSGQRNGSITIAGQTFNVTQSGTATGCQVSSFSGSGTAGYGEGIGASASWNAPVGAVIAKAPTSGNPNAVFIADATNNRIRLVYIDGASAGASSLIAGDGTAGYSEGAGNPLLARYNHPKGITAITDANGVVTSLLIADTDNHVIRKLDWNGSGWAPSIFSGQGGKGTGYVDGTASNSRFNAPQAISAASSTAIFVADTGNGKIRKLDQTGASTTQTSTGITTPVGVAAVDTKTLYVSDQARHTIWFSSSTSSTATRVAGNDVAGFADGTGTGALFNSPRQLVLTSGGVLYVADTGNFRVRKVVAGTQVVTTLAGSGTQGNADGGCSSATFKGPQGIAAFGPSGELYVVDTADNKIRKVQP